MTLLKREKKQQPNIKSSASTDRGTKKDLSASQLRKNIKVPPETFRKIQTICTLREFKQYQLIEELLDFYIANGMEEREQRMIKSIISNEK